MIMRSDLSRKREAQGREKDLRGSQSDSELRAKSCGAAPDNSPRLEPWVGVGESSSPSGATEPKPNVQ